MLAWAATIYPITRFLMEIIRTDEGPVFGTTLSISQNISLLILAGVAIFWIPAVVIVVGGIAFGFLFVRRARRAEVGDELEDRALVDEAQRARGSSL